jgi:hypothetical protein
MRRVGAWWVDEAGSGAVHCLVAVLHETDPVTHSDCRARMGESLVHRND